MHNNLKKREKEQERVRNYECPLTAWVPFGYQMKFFVDTEVNCQKRKTRQISILPCFALWSEGE